MKTLLLVITLDKFLHFGGSAVLSNVLKERYSPTQAFLITLAIGAVKESLDRRFDHQDMLANTLGAGFGIRWELKPKGIWK